MKRYKVGYLQGLERSAAIAIDFNLIPYYGDPSPSELPFIYRSKAKNGTCCFYAYATLYVIKKNKRVTLAIKAVRREDTKVAIITYLLALISPQKLLAQAFVFRQRVFLRSSNSLATSSQYSFCDACNY